MDVSHAFGNEVDADVDIYPNETTQRVRAKEKVKYTTSSLDGDKDTTSRTALVIKGTRFVESVVIDSSDSESE